MKPAYWKLSMGGGDFKTVLDVIDWIRHGVVVVHKDTRKKATSHVSQGQHFIEPDRDGDYFYLCHGNKEPSVILIGQFVGPANYFCELGDGYAERSFNWIRTSRSVKPYSGPSKWWTPNHNSTFIKVPDEELQMFEEKILQPYFDLSFGEFGQ